MKKATLFAHNGQVTAIAFPGEPMNYNGVAVAAFEAEDQDSLAAKILDAAPSGVGSPWPAIVQEKAAKEPKTPKTPKVAEVPKIPEAELKTPEATPE